MTKIEVNMRLDEISIRIQQDSNPKSTVRSDGAFLNCEALFLLEQKNPKISLNI